jgi:hypothetical protein
MLARHQGVLVAAVAADVELDQSFAGSGTHCNWPNSRSTKFWASASPRANALVMAESQETKLKSPIDDPASVSAFPLGEANRFSTSDAVSLSALIILRTLQFAA